MVSVEPNAEAILREWFKEPERWWKKDPDFDAHLATRWAGALSQAKKSQLDSWTNSARGALALVILLDQFGRNIHRDTPDMYAGDAKALAIADQAIACGYEVSLSPTERSFLYMPFMHSEDIRDQERSVQLFTALGMNVDFAVQHRDIVARFGRFPHRNAILERDSLPEEIEFLKQPGSSF